MHRTTLGMLMAAALAVLGIPSAYADEQQQYQGDEGTTAWQLDDGAIGMTAQLGGQDDTGMASASGVMATASNNPTANTGGSADNGVVNWATDDAPNLWTGELNDTGQHTYAATWQDNKALTDDDAEATHRDTNAYVEHAVTDAQRIADHRAPVVTAAEYAEHAAVDQNPTRPTEVVRGPGDTDGEAACNATSSCGTNDTTSPVHRWEAGFGAGVNDAAVTSSTTSLATRRTGHQRK